MWIVSTGFAYADALIGKGELVSIEALIVKDNCIRGCESDEWSIQPVALPAGYTSPAGSIEQLYLATGGTFFCGSRGCISAYVLRVGAHLIKIKEGWNLGHTEKIQAHEVLAVKQKIRPISSTSTLNTIFSPEPNFIVNKGQTIDQFTLKSFGEAFFSGQPMFPRGSYDYPEGGSYLAVYKSPGENHALVQLWDADKGGLRLALVDRVGSKVLNNQIIPDGNVLGLVKTDQVRWVNNGVAWSPDGRFAAVPYYFSEAEADLAVIDIVSGEFVIYPVRTNKSSSWAMPDLETIEWHPDNTLAVSFDVMRCADQNCEEFLVEPGKQKLSLSLSNISSKASSSRALDKIDIPPLLRKQVFRNTSQLKLGFLGVAAKERDFGIDGRNILPNDACYIGVTDALAAQAKKDFVNIALKELASNIFLTTVDLISTGSPTGDFLLKFGTQLLNSTALDKPVTETAILFIINKSIGYIARQSTESYILGKTVPLLYEKSYRDFIANEQLTAWKLIGSNVGTQSQKGGLAPLANINADIFYNPYSHYITALINANCSLLKGGNQENIYILRYKVLETKVKSTKIDENSLRAFLVPH